MKKAILLHGWGWNSENNWFPWAQEELKNRWFEVFAPNLPNSYQPILSEQLESISETLKDFKHWDIIIGHSLWCQLALHAIHSLDMSGVKAIFVGPSYPGTTEEIWRDLVWDSYEKLVNYNNETLEFQDFWNEYIICLSQNDEYINLEHAEEYYCLLEDVELLEFKDKGHFNNAAKVFELPEILEYFE
jgi:predicted alpha/beta hydrolase family esterase